MRIENAPGGGSSSLTIGTTAISGGSAGRVLYETSGNKIGEVSGATSDGTAITFTSGNLIATAPSFTTTLTLTRTSIGATPADGVILTNTTAAAAGAQQVSPSIRLTGQGWKTTATAASQTVDWQVYVLPVQGAAAPTSTLVFASQINAGGYSNVFTVTSAGLVTITASASFMSLVGSGGTHTIAQEGGSRILRFNNTEAIAVSDDRGFVWTAFDTGLARNAAGVVRISDGSVSWGKLLHGRVVTAKTGNYTVTANETNTFFTNTGASGAVVFTMPTPVVGMTYEFYRDADQTVTIDVGGAVVIRVGASASSAGGQVTLDAVGSRIRLVAVSTTLWVGDIDGAATFS